MSLPVPKLDDRHFQDLVDEAKKRIPHYTKEWTDHNVSDPGVTLVELFAFMTDVLLYRLNQVPDLHYVRFLEMLGVRLKPPQPARVPVTFWLSAPQPAPIVIPGGTEVASTQTETQPAIIFTTDQDFTVHPPQLAGLFSRVQSRESDKKSLREHNLRRLEAGFEGVEVFSSVPQVDDALYLGFNNDLSHHVLRLEADFDPAGGAGVDPTQPPYLVEASTGKETGHWQPCAIEEDTTRGMNVAGRLQIHLPAMGKYAVGEQTLYWVRVRVKDITPAETREGMQPYNKSPRVKKLTVTAIGGTIPATHARTIRSEFLGQSDGSPGQRFHLQQHPILSRRSGETLIVQVENQAPQEWIEVEHFAYSLSDDPCFTLDSVSGELRLGPAVRQPDGAMKLYGAVPPRGTNLVFSAYRTGGGQEGNVQTGIINTLKTAIPFISRVANRQTAWGGLDAESLESAMTRAPALLHSRERAVTEDDFEFLARQALPVAIGRVKCLQPSPDQAGRVIPGQVYLLVIPRLPNPQAYLDPNSLNLAEADMDALRAYMDERRLLTCRLDIRPPAYLWTSVRAQLHPSPDIEKSVVEGEVLARLYRFLNPLTGGPDGKGWPFGRTLYISDVYQSLQGLPGVQFVRSVEMYATRPGGGPEGSPVESIEVIAHGVIASGKHEVKFI
ncbi:MAG: putative baseplate assembly protein [Anaerolineaceae bacterium]|nr:putative baseplate assembly protein [Anaerolineaceae bacterium]